jgi:putative flippase GtrA
MNKKKQIVKFFLTGGFGAGGYVIGSFALTNVGIKPWIASFVVYASFIPIIYLMQKKIVFESDRAHSESFPRYLTISLIGLGLSATLPLLFVNIDINPAISFIIVILFISLTNYFLQLYWVFSANKLK